MLLLASALAAAPALADNTEVQLGPEPDWAVPSELMAVPADPSGLVFVRRQDTLVHLDEDGQQQYLGYRIKILHQNALALGNLGGHLNRKRDGLPGWITLWRGWLELRPLVEGFLLAHKLKRFG